PLPAGAGHNRFVWNLRTPRPRALEYEFSIAAVSGADTPEVPQGLFVMPGRYEVRLTVDGQTLSQPLTVAMDPRAHPAPADLAAQHGFYQEVAQAMELTTSSQERVEARADRLEKLDQELAGRPASHGRGRPVQGRNDGRELRSHRRRPQRPGHRRRRLRLRTHRAAAGG